jgi:hypothetical protein
MNGIGNETLGLGRADVNRLDPNAPGVVREGPSDSGRPSALVAPIAAPFAWTVRQGTCTGQLVKQGGSPASVAVVIVQHRRRHVMSYLVVFQGGVDLT